MKLLLPLLVILMTPFLLADGPPSPSLPAQARELPLDDVQKLITERKDISILDVRTAEEVSQVGRMFGSKHLDFFHGEFTAELAKIGFDPAKPCVVYCAIGGRAKRAAGLLAQAGFKDIVLPAGGFNAWKKAGMPVEGGGVKK